MADKKISQLPDAATLDGTETAPVVQSGSTKKTTISQVSDYVESRSVGEVVVPALRMLTTDLNDLSLTRDAAGRVTEAVANGMTHEVRRDVNNLITQVGGVQVDSTFNRDSVAADPYTGAESAVDVPRFVTVDSRTGLMVEEGTVNIYANPGFESATFAGWQVYDLTTGLTYTSDQAFAQVTTAAKFAGSQCFAIDHVNGLFLFQSNGAGSGAYSLTFYVRRQDDAPVTGADVFAKPNNGGSVAFDTITDVGVGADGHTWYRCVKNNVTWTAAKWGILVAAGSAVYVDNGQFENKSYATSWMSGTRAAETLAVPTDGIISPSEGTVIVPVYVSGRLLQNITGGSMLFMVADPTTLRNEIVIFRDAASNWRAQLNSDGGVTSYAAGSAALSEGWHVFGMRYGGGNVSLWIDGVMKQESAATMPSALNGTAWIGSNNSGTGQPGQPISVLQIFMEALTDAEMAEYTTLATLPTEPLEKHSLFLPLTADLLNQARVVNVTNDASGLVTGMTRAVATLA